MSIKWKTMLQLKAPSRPIGGQRSEVAQTFNGNTKCIEPCVHLGCISGVIS